MKAVAALWAASVVWLAVSRRLSPEARARRAARRRFLAEVEAVVIPGDPAEVAEAAGPGELDRDFFVNPQPAEDGVPGDLRPGGLVRRVPVPGGRWARVPQPRRGGLGGKA